MNHSLSSLSSLLSAAFPAHFLPISANVISPHQIRTLPTPAALPLRRTNNRKEVYRVMAVKKSVWDTILKVIIAVASAIAGALGANAMTL